MKLSPGSILPGGCLILLLAAGGCSPKAYTRGAYVDPGRVDLLSDKFVESDLQQIAEQLTSSLLADPLMARKGGRPAIIISLWTNATDEHIDILSLTQKIRTLLFKSGNFRFLNERLRQAMAEEYEYQQSGFVSAETAKAKGAQIGADWLISGHISAIKQPVGKQEIVYYKTTMELTDLTTSELVWTGEVELKKAFRKKRIGF